MQERGIAVSCYEERFLKSCFPPIRQQMSRKEAWRLKAFSETVFRTRVGSICLTKSQEKVLKKLLNDLKVCLFVFLFVCFVASAGIICDIVTFYHCIFKRIDSDVRDFFIRHFATLDKLFLKEEIFVVWHQSIFSAFFILRCSLN